MRIKLFTTMFIVLFVAGCVPSLHQLWTKKTLVYDKTIEGNYEDEDNDMTWEFVSDPNNKSYIVFVADEEDIKKHRKSKLSGHLVNIDKQLFLDLYPADNTKIECGNWLKIHLLRSHLFLKIEKTEEGLLFSVMNPKTIRKLLKEKPGLIEHEILEDGRMVLTDTPDNLQRFLLEGMKIEEFFCTPSKLEPAG